MRIAIPLETSLGRPEIKWPALDGLPASDLGTIVFYRHIWMQIEHLPSQPNPLHSLAFAQMSSALSSIQLLALVFFRVPNASR